MNDDWIKQGDPEQIASSAKSSPGRELIERYTDPTTTINADKSMKEADKAIDIQFIFSTTLLHIPSPELLNYI